MWGCVTGAEIRVGDVLYNGSEIEADAKVRVSKMMGHGRKARCVRRCLRSGVCITTCFVASYMGIGKHLPKKPGENVLLFVSR
jgi:hypothetical protein